MLKRVVRLLEENLAYERAHLGTKEHSEDAVSQIEKAINILKMNIPERLEEITDEYEYIPRNQKEWSEVGIDLLFDIRKLHTEVNNVR